MIGQLVSDIFMSESVNARTDGRKDRRRLVSHPISSLRAFGSGELKRKGGGGLTLYEIDIGFCQYIDFYNIPDKKRNAPRRTVQLSGKSQVIGQFSLYQCKGMPVTAASHVFCNQASKLC